MYMIKTISSSENNSLSNVNNLNSQDFSDWNNHRLQQFVLAWQIFSLPNKSNFSKSGPTVNNLFTGRAFQLLLSVTKYKFNGNNGDYTGKKQIDLYLKCLNILLKYGLDSNKLPSGI